ncbi:hypothetical protein Tco_1340339, partial [Tanacetum coccineum]
MNGILLPETKKQTIWNRQSNISSKNSSELGHGLLSCWLSSHHHHGGGEVHAEKYVAHHTVNLLTSTIKVDAEQSDLKFFFWIISPKTTIVCRLRVPWIKWIGSQVLRG